MNKVLKSANDMWIKWGILIMATVFVAVMMWMISRQYATFDTRSADLDRFIQAIWNTTHGRFLYSTIEERSVLSGHFTPFFAFLAPLLWLWPDPRILSLAQTIGLAIAGIVLYKIVQRKYPAVAPWFALAYFLNPALHELALLELRRITFAVPFLATAFYALSIKNRKLLLGGLFFALLCKEDVALIVIMFGVYLLIVERDWRWGGLLMGIGAAWLLMVLLWINPALDPIAGRAVNQVEAYRGLRYFAGWGGSIPDIAANLLRRPFGVLQYMFDASGRAALWRIFLPLGIVLPFLEPSVALIALPALGYMLLSSNPSMHQLDNWYPGSVLPVLFAAIAISLIRRSEKWAWGITAVFLTTAIIGYTQFSYALFGGKYNPVKYEIIPHHQRAAEIVASIPQDAVVAATSAYTPQLAQRSTIYMFPWVPTDAKPIDYLVLDRYLKSYPMNEIERNDAINNIIVDPSYVIATEVDGIYVLRPNGTPRPGFVVNKTAEAAIQLERVEISPANETGYFETAVTQPIVLQPGQTVRVTLYWRAVAHPVGERTVSVRIAGAAGQLLAQQDMQPVNGTRPTSWWEPGWYLRDVYYLTLSPQAQSGAAALQLLLYDSFTQEPVPFDSGEAMLNLADIKINRGE